MREVNPCGPCCCKGAREAKQMLTRDLTRHWDAATARLRHARVIGLFLDFDGTLSRICLKPNEALMDSGIRRTLAVLANSSRFRVWIVSGRRLHDVSERGRVPNVRYLGVHGWEGARVNGHFHT